MPSIDLNATALPPTHSATHNQGTQAQSHESVCRNRSSRSSCQFLYRLPHGAVSTDAIEQTDSNPVLCSAATILAERCAVPGGDFLNHNSFDKSATLNARGNSSGLKIRAQLACFDLCSGRRERSSGNSSKSDDAFMSSTEPRPIFCLTNCRPSSGSMPIDHLDKPHGISAIASLPCWIPLHKANSVRIAEVIMTSALNSV